MSTITENAGALLIGLVVSATLYGIANLQVSYYYMTYHNDNIRTKILVFILWVLETIHTVFTTFSVHHYLIANYGNPSSFAVGHWSLFMSMGVNITTACIAQSFFAYQIYHVCGNRRIRWPVMVVIIIMITGHIAFGYVSVATDMMLKRFAKISETKFERSVPFAIFSVSSDVAIAVPLTFLLQNSRTGLSRTNRLLNTLTIYAIHRCLLTTLVAVVEVIVYAAKPHSFYYLAIDFSIGKLWSNSVFATLNSRNYVRKVVDNRTVTDSIKISHLQFASGSEGNSNPPQADSNIGSDAGHVTSAQNKDLDCPGKR